MMTRSLFALMALLTLAGSAQAELPAFTSCHDQGTITRAGAGNSCAVFSRARKARDAAVDDAQADAQAFLESFDFIWGPWCESVCEDAGLESRGYVAGGLCGETILELDEFRGNRCGGGSLGRRAHAEVEVRFDTGCLCRG